MAAFDFPNNPAVGDRTTNVGITYIWDGQKWVNGTTPSSNVQTNCVVFTGPAGPMYECLDANGNIQVSDKNKVGKVWITQQGGIGVGTAAPNSIIHAVAQDPALTLLSNSQNPDSSYSNLIIAAVSNATTNPDFTAYADSALIMTKGGTQLNIAPSDSIELIPGAGGVYAVPITTGLGGYAFTVDFTTYNVGVGPVQPIYRLDVSTADLGPTLSKSSQVHIASNNADTGGGYLTSVTDNGFHVSAGAAYNGATGWIAKTTTAEVVSLHSSGNIFFNINTGLTVGIVFTATARMTITPLGNVGIGNGASVMPDVGTNAIRLIVGSTAASNTNPGNVTITSNGTGWGSLNFANYDIAATEKRLGIIQGVPNPANNSGNLVFYTMNAGTSAERMRIAYQGFVGIGTGSPAGQLEVAASGTSGPTLIIRNNNATSHNCTLQFAFQTGVAWNFSTDYSGTGASEMNFINSGGTRVMTLIQSGNVGINVGAPISPFHVHTGTNANFMVQYGGGGGQTVIGNMNDAGTAWGATQFWGSLGLSIGPTYQLQLSADSAGKPGTTTWTVVSDIRTKQNVQRFEGDMEVIRKLNPTVSEYNGKAQTPKGLRVVSFDPDELKAIVPQCVTYVKGKLDPADKAETDIAGINTHEIFFHLLRAVQQIDTRLQKVEPK